MISSNLTLAIDGGGTRTRCAVYTEHGARLAIAEAGPGNYLSAGWDVALESLQTAIVKALATCGATKEEVNRVSVALPGVNPDGSGADVTRQLLSEAGWPGASVFSDMVAAQAGAFAGGPGVIVIAGTGSVSFGVAPDGSSAKVGGYGYLFGDEGSGVWIAREALNAASRANDGRGPSTALVGEFCQEFGLSKFSDCWKYFYLKPQSTRQLAQISQVVNRVAMQGDELAGAILHRAGEELALLAIVLIEQLKMTASPPVSIHGGVLTHCCAVRETFEASLRKAVPAVLLREPAGDSLFGGFLLAV